MINSQCSEKNHKRIKILREKVRYLKDRSRKPVIQVTDIKLFDYGGIHFKDIHFG